MLRADTSSTGLGLTLEGAWHAPTAAAAEHALAAVDLPAGGSVTLRLAVDRPLDLAAASLIEAFEQRCRAAGLGVDWPQGRPAALLLLDRYPPQEITPAAAGRRRRSPVEVAAGLGKRTFQAMAGWQEALVLLGKVMVAFGRGVVAPRRLRGISITRHLYETGLQAVPIVALIAFLIAVIVAYIGAKELRAFGQEIYVVDLITLSVLRELAVLLTAIIVAGRSGSAFAAELGAMRLNDEVDALEAMGLDPVEVLVLPRVLALFIAMPLLTIVADFMGLAGGAVLSWSLVDIPFNQFLTRMDEAIAPTTFWAGLIKAPVFGLLIALVGTLRGLQVRGSSRELGRLTTLAVVQGIFLVILADALFAVLYLEIDF